MPTLDASGDDTDACAFLFDNSTDGVPDPQLAFFTSMVLAALAEVDPDGVTHSQLKVGLPMLPGFATRTTEVHGHASGSGHTESHDVDTYKYIIWEWLDSLSHVWSSIDLEKGEQIFRQHTGECVTLVTLGRRARDKMDRKLRSSLGYVGAFAIDPGHPLHRRGFVEGLIYAAAVAKGTVIQERSIEGDEDWPVEGAAAFKPGGLVWRPYGWLAEHGPKGLAKLTLSERGKRAAEAVARKHAPTVEGRVIEAISRAFSFGSSRRSFGFKAVGTQEDILEAIMPEGKFTHYLFNPEHKLGGPKSAFFIDILGIDPQDWRYLAAQFYQGLTLAEPANLELIEWNEGYGMRFNVQMRVRGRSGATAVVRTGWMMKPGQLPSLATAVPGDRDAIVVDPGEPRILPPGPRTDEHWRCLWEWANSAGERAIVDAVPTPMYLVGYAPIPEGEVGATAIRVKDARGGFARWLARHGPGETDRRGGCIAFSPNSIGSLDRAQAWARAVALVLTLNGIHSEIEKYES
jgi:hypothetical protein